MHACLEKVIGMQVQNSYSLMLTAGHDLCWQSFGLAC